MTIKCMDPRKIHDAYKEAVVDSLLNNLSARVSGRGEFYSVVFGNKPSKALISEFLLPMPEAERQGDEEADPIQISAHGLDFQIGTEARNERLCARLTGAVYVRILPTADDVCPGGRLELSFPLTNDAERALKDEVNAALRRLREQLAGGDRNPAWRERSLEARRSAYAAMGLPFEPTRDRSGESEDDASQEADGETDEEGEEDESRIRVTSRGQPIPDSLASDSAMPAKWLRIDLDLPEFEFSPATAAVDARTATDALNAAIAARLRAWADAENGPFAGKPWGYRRGLRVRPSHQQNWEQYLAAVRASGEAVLVPAFDLRWVANATEDPLDPTRTSVHLALENWTPPLNRNNAREIEPAFFQVSVSVVVPAAAHRPLHLERVKPSYRYNRYLKYPALGFNGGVVQTAEGQNHRLTTTWSPRYILPRIVPTVGEVELNIARLAQEDSLAGLAPLIPAYERWLEGVAQFPVDRGLEGPHADELKARERDKLQQDLAKWNQELAAIRVGIEILKESRSHWSGPGPQDDPGGIPFESWLSMNATMAQLATAKGYTDWRLFQLAFIIASIPAFATRIPAFASYYTPEVEQQANAVTLLYFATGGGKSEAFLGLLVFVVFLDRLRGKHCGVSALMRYPLRLLTLQQARRTFATLGAAEHVRFTREHPGEPFSLGFWVGGSNTPNWHKEDGYSDIPTERAVAPGAESVFLTEPASKKYRAARDRWLKLPTCPFCSSKNHPLALRRWSGRGGNALGHFCSSPKAVCSWNNRFEEATPLPFYVVDEDIYDLSPTVLLGTIDKLAALGQSQGTIRKFFGMFGFAPFLETDSDRLFVPGKTADWDGLPGPEAKGLFPSYADGIKRFFDPFPSLLIQDEAHLLDESLGTFAGLFESALEAAFDELAPVLGDQVVGPPGRDGRRKIKVIAASATVSEPQRQMRNLYQRFNTVQFPHPGPDLYESFYAIPKQPDDSPEDDERRRVPIDEMEVRSHWARVYAAVLTNGHRHTVAMASLLGHFHLLITGLYERLQDADPARCADARAELVRWVSTGQNQAQFQRLLNSADEARLLTLVDLHRIALTYVTNKKGGDQVIDTEKSESERLHHEAGFTDHKLSSNLLSGAVSAADIQDIVRRAEKRVAPGEEFPPLNDTLRSVIATSAISHGVDVEEFNAMFFAGMPSDIAEYIQASSRVGRTHVGFSLLVPIPQRYRDRFVTEIHDIFHRFLERMILPASIDRWAEKALLRVMPSFFQEFVCGIQVINAICAAERDRKPRVPTQGWAIETRAYLSHPDHVRAAQQFMERALGFGFDPPPEGLAYYKAALRQQLNLYQQDLQRDELVTGTKLTRFFEVRDRLNRPMTSLRDVDLPGVIYESSRDAGASKVGEGVTARAMQFIRRGTGADIDSTDERTELWGAD